MAKKYLTIEEAAEILGVEPSVLTRLREKGEIRAFADRGNWKFREDDVEELARKRQTDSDPDVPIFTPKESKKDNDLSETLMFEEPKAGSGDSSLVLGEEAEKSLGEQPTIVRKGGLEDLTASDSDVRLVFDDSLMPDPISDSSAPLGGSEQSDSDVRLISSGKSDEGSDSDVKLVPDKAAVRPGAGEGSDSDVTLIGARNDSSDEISLDLEQSDGSFVLGGETSGIALEGVASSDEDSGITLDLPNDSGIALEADSGISFVGGDSGISLDTGSGISLEADDSSLVLAGDSGISLGGPSDSGIALEGLTSDSKTKNKNKKKPDLGGTVPEIPALRADDDDMAATTMEVPTLGGQDSEFEFTASPLDDDSSGSVMLGGLDEPPTRGRKGKKADSDVFDTAATAEFAADDDEFDSTEEVFDADDASDEMEVAEDIIGEDDEISEDVFGAGDEDFDDDMQSGQSSADFVVPSSAPRSMAPIQAEWGGGTFAMLMVSSVVMLLTTFLMYDVVHTMWGNNEPNAGTEMILSSFRGMFG